MLPQALIDSFNAAMERVREQLIPLRDEAYKRGKQDGAKEAAAKVERLQGEYDEKCDAYHELAANYGPAIDEAKRLLAKTVGLETENQTLLVRLENRDAEIKRLWEKCFNNVMTAKKSGYEEGQAGIKRLRGEADRLRADRDACIEFIKTELQWCDFRGDMMSDNASVKNARKLAEFLDRRKAAEAASKGGE